MKNRSNYMIAGAALLLFLLIGGAVINGITKKPNPTPTPSTDVCKDIPYVRMDPVVPEGSVAFGPSIETRVKNALTLTGQEQVNAVKKDELTVGCQYASQTLSQAIHRGIVAWPTSDQSWIDQLLKLDADRKEQHELMGKVVKWDTEASAEVVYLKTSYNSDWLQRTGFGPMLRQGPGHDKVAGWVIRWTHINADGTTSVVVERLVCMYQWVGKIPPTVPPTGEPPCKNGGCKPTTTTTTVVITSTTNPSSTVPQTTVPTTTTVPCTGVIKGQDCEHPPASPSIPPTTVRVGGAPTTLGPSPTAAPDPVPTGPIVTVDPTVVTVPKNVGGGQTGVTIPPTTAPLPTTPPATIPPGQVGSG